ncbi:MAG: hypothetical protein IPI97_01275 [Nitrosomonas sp.]|nr:hypothetical protein [Nitrosomonas sp.]MBK7363686.1 hypothetical protein [Nitrosomonas sp.]
MPNFKNDPIESKTETTARAISGISDNKSNEAGPGVYGESLATGVWGNSKTWMGVFGESKSTTGGAGVMGQGNPGPGVIGTSTEWIGVYGETAGMKNGPAGVWGEHKGAGIGVKAVSKDGAGLVAHSITNEAIHAETHSPKAAAVAAYNLNSNNEGFAIFGKKEGSSGFAGFFDGNVWVSKKLTVGDDIVLANADCAEDFNVAGEVKVEPGTVMVLGNEGALFESHQAYDKRVAGVISGAGTYKPGIVLDKQQSETGNRQPVALMGKVFCKVDAQFGAIEVGDLLTTSPTLGHAMKVDDPMKSLGAMIGKALSPLKEGQGMIPILIALQ